MNNSRHLLIIVGIFLTSCYFFPFVLATFSFANSKMLLAIIGLFILGTELVQKKKGIINKDFFTLSLWAFALSLISFGSMTLNNTQDNTFNTYFMSMWVWMGGAYTVISFIKKTHGRVSVPIIVNYLLAVCVFQCVLALIFENFPTAERWHTQTFAGEAYMGNTNDERLHGIGCSLDVAGFRFSAVIIMTIYIMNYLSKYKKIKYEYAYLGAIIFISIIGNMISRSTIIGVVIALLYQLWILLTQNENKSIIAKLSILIVITISITTYLYNTDKTFRENLRFGFEGFFSIAEKGSWETNSNKILKGMITWPDNAKTWIIGDGYINNPLDKQSPTYDPYYIGEIKGGYYKGTDIGYCRYIFYFGIIGLITFSILLTKACTICISRAQSFKWMFILVLAINFIQWLKVSTDLFVVFAPFLCLGLWENETAEQESLEHLETAEQ